jgi:N-acetylglucosamine-6-phosphate deacetylase
MRHLQIEAAAVKIWPVPERPPLLLRAGQVLVEGRLRAGVDVLVDGDTLTALGAGLMVPADARVVDLPAGVLSPGFVDLHVHALDGRGLVGPAAPDVEGLSQALARRGVTGFLATTAAAPLEQLQAVLQGLPYDGGGARCLGVHLEGPWLSGQKAGAQPQQALRLPDLDALDRLLAAGPPAMLTLAPELAGAEELIRRAAEAGVVVSLGHSTATYDQACQAVEAGARHITHCFNAMPGLHHREPGLVGAALDLDGVTVEAIADGVHLHPAVVRLLWRACGPGRVCLVSDAVDVNADVNVDVDVPGTGVARLPDGTLAGSRIGLDTAVRNLVAWGIPLADALTMASTTPAAVLGRRHVLEVGATADLVLLDANLDVAMTVVAGRALWER